MNRPPPEEPPVGEVDVQPELGHAARDAELDALVRHVAHEVNNPLAALIADIDLTREILAEGRDDHDLSARVGDARRLLAGVRQAAERIRVVVKHLQANAPLDVARTRPGLTTLGVMDPASEQQRARTVRVLVVDDDPMVGSSLRRCLRDHDVVVVDSARDALAHFTRGDRFDLIICDLTMPEMTGADLHEAVTRLAPDQAERMVFLTGGALTTRLSEFMAAVPNVILEKPFDGQKLRELVRSWMR